MAEFIRLYEKNPNERELDKVVKLLKGGAVIIFPTDTIYALGCDMNSSKAIEKVARIKGLDMDKARLSLICHDLSNISDYVQQFDTPIYKMLKRALPGPYTFIMNGSKALTKKFKKRKTAGIRVPNNNITRAIVEKLGNPMISTSIKDEDEIIEYTTDPELIYEKYGKLVDLVIDGGIGENNASTVIDLCGDEPVIIREGLGSLDVL